MKKLTKTNVKELDEAATKMREAESVLQNEIDEYIVAIDNAHAKLTTAYETFNGLVSDVESLRESIVNEMEDATSDRSDRWRESDAGSAFESWKANFEEEFEEVECPEKPEEPEMPDSIADKLDELPREIE